MQLLIKQRIFSLRETFDVYDEEEQPRWYIEGKLFSIPKEIYVFDQENRQYAAIRQKLWKLMPQYELWLGEQYFGCIRQLFGFRPRYELADCGWRVEGDFWGWDYRILDERGELVAALTKEPLHWGDTYVLDIPDPQNELPCLLIVLAIDAAIEQAQSSN